MSYKMINKVKVECSFCGWEWNEPEKCPSCGRKNYNIGKIINTKKRIYDSEQVKCVSCNNFPPAFEGYFYKGTKENKWYCENCWKEKGRIL